MRSCFCASKVSSKLRTPPPSNRQHRQPSLPPTSVISTILSLFLTMLWSRPPYLDRKRPYGYSNQSLSENNFSPPAANFSPPVIVKLIDGKVNFREMKIAERDAFNAELYALSGQRAFRDSNIPRGGDLFVYPSDLEQQNSLLSLNNKEVANRKVACSLPTSYTPHHKGVIFGVPLGDSVDEIKEALKDQDVVDVQRSINRADNNRPLSSVFLFFKTGLPSHVKIASVSYEVKRHIPTPFRCKTCWHLGHTSAHCSSAPKCKKCGGTHDLDFICVTKCVNCGRPDHESDSLQCPSYQDSQSVIKLSVQNNISISEARAKFNSLYSTRAAQRFSPNPSHNQAPPPPCPATVPQDELNLLKTQVATLREELTKITESTIPAMAANVTAVQSDLAVVKADCANNNARFDTIDKHFLDLKNHLTLLLSARPQIAEPTGPMFSGQKHQPACLNQSFSPPVGIPFSPLMDQSSLTDSHNGATGSQYEMEDNGSEY